MEREGEGKFGKYFERKQGNIFQEWTRKSASQIFYQGRTKEKSL